MIWRTIPGFPSYEASASGKIRRVGASRPLRSAVDSTTGYAKLTIYNADGNLKTVSVHRTVCRAFHGEPPVEGMEACHQNGIKIANQSDNLYWGSRVQNRADRTRHESERGALHKKGKSGRFLGGPKTKRAIQRAFKEGKLNKTKAIEMINALNAAVAQW